MVMAYSSLKAMKRQKETWEAVNVLQNQEPKAPKECSQMSVRRRRYGRKYSGNPVFKRLQALFRYHAHPTMLQVGGERNGRLPGKIC